MIIAGVISAGQLQTTQAYATGQTFGQIQVNLAAEYLIVLKIQPVKTLFAC